MRRKTGPHGDLRATMHELLRVAQLVMLSFQRRALAANAAGIEAKLRTNLVALGPVRFRPEHFPSAKQCLRAVPSVSKTRAKADRSDKADPSHRCAACFSVVDYAQVAEGSGGTQCRDECVYF